MKGKETTLAVDDRLQGGRDDATDVRCCASELDGPDERSHNNLELNDSYGGRGRQIRKLCVISGLRVLTESVPNAAPWSVAESDDIAPSTRQLTRRGNTPWCQPAFGLEFMTVRAPDIGVYVHGCEGQVEDLNITDEQYTER